MRGLRKYLGAELEEVSWLPDNYRPPVYAFTETPLVWQVSAASRATETLLHRGLGPHRTGSLQIISRLSATLTNT